MAEKNRMNTDFLIKAVNLYTDKGMALEEIARLAEKQLDTVNSVLIVMNKVSQARGIYDLIDCGCEKVYLSTKKCGAHRLETIEYIKKRTEQLCKNKSSDKLIVVSTQLVEAGVDFSFECAIRAIAGVNSIAQIAGRCNRNGEYDKICKVFLVNVANEDLSKLTDIRKAKNSTKTLLSRDKNTDLLSADAVKKYYGVHFNVESGESDETESDKRDYMDYITDDKNTIMDLLSVNKEYVRQYARMSLKAELPMLCQAFETAGRKFRVIDNETQPVIVPYGEGRKYIERLTGDADIREKMDIVRRCSRYSVNLYGWELEKLKDNALYFVDDIGVWILKNEHYSEEYGIKENPQMSFMYY